MKTVTITDIMADFLDSIRAYEHESGSAITFDERESSEFVNIYFNGEGKLKIEEKKPLFTTDDGVEIFLGQVYFSIDIEFNKRGFFAINPELAEGIKTFKHESNADKYIWRNKRVFSYEDFIKWGNVPYERVIIQLAKERSKQ